MSVALDELEKQLDELEGKEHASAADVLVKMRLWVANLRGVKAAPVEEEEEAVPVLPPSRKRPVREEDEEKKNEEEAEDEDDVVVVPQAKRIKGDKEKPDEAKLPESVVGPYVMTDAQEPVVVRSVECCQRLGRFVNESDGGAGKTPCTVEAAHRLKLPILGIGLSGTMAAKWRNHAYRQKVILLEYISWDSLRGARAKGTDKAACSKYPNVAFPVKLSHGWLSRRDSWTGKWTTQSTRNNRTRKTVKKRVKVYDSVYAPTAQLLEAIAKGVLVVADEVQKAKNESKMNSALSCIVSSIYAESDSLLAPGKGGSCMMALSATTLDKPEHALRICRVLGLLPPVMDEAFSYDRASGMYEPSNGQVQRFTDLCKDLDSTAYAMAEKETLQNGSGYIHVDNRTGRVVTGYTPATKLPHHIRREVLPSKERPSWFMFMLYVSIIRKQLSGAVSQRYDADPNVTLDFKSIIYRVPEDKQAEFDRLTQELEDARTDRAPPDVIDAIRKQQELLKHSLFVSEPRKILLANPQAKVFCVLNYIDTIKYVADGLKEFGVGLIYGQIGTAARQRTLDAFQAPNGNLRVIVGQVTACTAGIDLHDVTGLWPRYTFISPSPMATDLQQALKRTKRNGVKGLVTVTVVYGASGDTRRRDADGRRVADEAETMQNLTRKSCCHKATAEQQNEDGVVFMGSLPVYRQMANGELVLEQLEEERSEEDDRRDMSDVEDQASGEEDDELDEEADATGTNPSHAFFPGDKVKMYQTSVGGNQPWLASIVCAINPDGTCLVATARNAQRPGSKIVRVSVPVNLLAEPTREDLSTHWRLFQFNAGASAVSDLESLAASFAPVLASPPPPPLPSKRAASDFMNPTPSPSVVIPSDLPIRQPQSQQQYRQSLLTEQLDRANQVGVKLANGLAWLSNDWSACGNVPRAVIEAVRVRFGEIPPESEWSFSVNEQSYRSVTHFLHSSLAFPDTRAQEIRDAATPEEARRMWPLPMGNGGHNAPQVRRLLLEGLRARVEQSAFTQRVLKSTGSASLSTVDPTIDNTALLSLVRGRL
jgi:hypothetical protein